MYNFSCVFRQPSNFRMLWVQIFDLPGVALPTNTKTHMELMMLFSLNKTNKNRVKSNKQVCNSPAAALRPGPEE